MGAKLDLMRAVFSEPEIKEKKEIPKEKEAKELAKKLATLTGLKSTLINPAITESKIVFNYLKESGCIENKKFYNDFNNSCREILLNIA